MLLLLYYICFHRFKNSPFQTTDQFNREKIDQPAGTQLLLFLTIKSTIIVLWELLRLFFFIVSSMRHVIARSRSAILAHCLPQFINKLNYFHCVSILFEFLTSLSHPTKPFDALDCIMWRNNQLIVGASQTKRRVRQLRHRTNKKPNLLCPDHLSHTLFLSINFHFILFIYTVFHKVYLLRTVGDEEPTRCITRFCQVAWVNIFYSTVVSSW